MANVVFSLIGPDLAPADIVVTGGPAATVAPNTSASNTQTTLRRSYAVALDAATSKIVIETGLPAQDAGGSYALSLVPDGAVVADGAEVYARGLVAKYSPNDGKLTIEESAASAAAAFFVSVDLAHSVTR